jgi:hypothetical protein
VKERTHVAHQNISVRKQALAALVTQFHIIPDLMTAFAFTALAVAS